MLGLYILGDSAYSIRFFLLVPFDNASAHSVEDGFNYHLSTCRIWVECAFGEIDMRWGILWRALPFSLRNNVKVIDAAMRLHNFIVAYRMRHIEASDPTEVREYQDETEALLRENRIELVGVVTGDDGIDHRGREWGRLPRTDQMSRHEGQSLRQELTDALRPSFSFVSHPSCHLLFASASTLQSFVEFGPFLAET